MKSVRVGDITQILSMDHQSDPVGCLTQCMKSVRVRNITQILVHHLQNLIARPQSGILESCPLFVHFVNENGTQEGVTSAHDGKTQTHGFTAPTFVLADFYDGVRARNNVTSRWVMCECGLFFSAR